MTLILGLDPSLSCTGWGVIRAEGSRLAHIAHGEVPSAPAMPMPLRLAGLYAAIQAVIVDYRPERAAVEEVFVNQNAQSTLKLAQARGAVLAACGAAGLPVAEHAARLVKKSVVGTGGADKRQVQAMLRVLLPGITVTGADAADALAVAIADAHLSPRTTTP
ncbi:crossover junction endodeoxyribonuclease RuvC [Qipengyuania sp. YIM B01966]|uniref:crossover junction endodeoxyribonuclease RuvC n=1 Tax=Qipengyuania sp. YIM B01966 TaxID=2778646 RepID=UPI0018F6E346|nr:crossover junction endodeoxyribonuclease RuvC [Qipengyuania sp. YIM B01966]